MEWTPKLSTYRQKVETDISNWMDYEIPKILPLCIRKKVFKRKYPSKLRDIMERYESRLDSQEIQFLSEIMMSRYETIYRELETTYQKIVGMRTKK